MAIGYVFADRQDGKIIANTTDGSALTIEGVNADSNIEPWQIANIVQPLLDIAGKEIVAAGMKFIKTREAVPVNE